jgi:hypothetical protein
MMHDFDNDVLKHAVRYYEWLPASLLFKKNMKKKKIKYFTLCAKQAIDVFMFELAEILSRDRYDNLPNVYICEKDPKDANEIYKVVRPPLKDALIVGELEKILLFKDTKDTKNRKINDPDVRSFKIRKLLIIKERSERLKSYFPFDIINFDPYGNLLNPIQEVNKLYQSFKKIFKLQKDIASFLLFVTTTISHIDPECEIQLKQRYEQNISSHDQIRNIIKSYLGTLSYDDADKNKKLAIAFSKLIISSAAREEGWIHKHYGIIIYKRKETGEKMISSVIQFTRSKQNISETDYINDIANIIQSMPRFSTTEMAEKDSKVKNDLKRIVDYRKSIRSKY